MATQFKVVGIIGRAGNPGTTDTLQSLITYLQSRQQAFLVETETVSILNNTSLPTVLREDISKYCNLLIVVGGDGSLLQAVHAVINDQIPVLGINRGRLGFLTDILPAQLEKIGPMLEGDYISEKRFLLTASVECQGKQLGYNDSLNEVALIPASVPHMSEFEIYINNQFLCSQDSDGLIVATPTGSTAYALSGGGPILHPQLNAIVIVPMFPHTLSIRPIVIEGDSEIKIVITPNNSTTPRITCDSQDFINAPPGSHIIIRKKSEQLHLIHPKSYDYYEALRSKLHWGRKLHYTE